MRSAAIPAAIGALLLCAMSCRDRRTPRETASRPSRLARRYGAWSAPQHFGVEINSPYDDQRPALSPDGLSLYFGSNRPGGAGGTVEKTDLWVARRSDPDTPFSPAKPLGGALSSPFDENAPAFAPDGRSLYFGSDRPGGCGDYDLWMSRRDDPTDDAGWGPPRNLGCALNSPFADDGAQYLAGPDRIILFTSNRPGGPGDFDLYQARLDREGNAGAAELVRTLSTARRDSRSALRADGLELIFATARTGGPGGLDLWATTRESTTAPWTPPRPMDGTVNSLANDGGPALSSDATTLMFDSTRGGGFGGRDLYFSCRVRLYD